MTKVRTKLLVTNTRNVHNVVASPITFSPSSLRNTKCTGPFHLCSGILVDILKLDNGDRDAIEQDGDLPLEEALISTSSVVLTLMVTMLELGSEKRPDEEEVILRSMLPSLAMLAHFSERSRVGRYAISGQPELAEMASHAMSLIAARSQMPSISVNREANGRSK